MAHASRGGTLGGGTCLGAAYPWGEFDFGPYWVDGQQRGCICGGYTKGLVARKKHCSSNATWGLFKGSEVISLFCAKVILKIKFPKLRNKQSSKQHWPFPSGRPRRTIWWPSNTSKRIATTFHTCVFLFPLSQTLDIFLSLFLQTVYFNSLQCWLSWFNCILNHIAPSVILMDNWI